MTVSGQSTHSSGLMFEKDLALAATGKESKQTKAHPGQTNKHSDSGTISFSKTFVQTLLSAPKAVLI